MENKDYLILGAVVVGGVLLWPQIKKIFGGVDDAVSGAAGAVSGVGAVVAGAGSAIEQTGGALGSALSDTGGAIASGVDFYKNNIFPPTMVANGVADLRKQLSGFSLGSVKTTPTAGQMPADSITLTPTQTSDLLRRSGIVPNTGNLVVPGLLLSTASASTSINSPTLSTPSSGRTMNRGGQYLEPRIGGGYTVVGARNITLKPTSAKYLATH
jgi:hypothetical protein